MKKRLMIMCAVMLTTLSASAQFEEGKVYIGTSLTGLNLSYNGLEKFNLGMQAQAGYMVYDNWMVQGQAGYQHYGSDAMADQIWAGVGLRYYIIENGLFIGAGAKLVHANHSYNDVMPNIELGYAFFINGTVTIEPAIYYNQSFKSHSDYSTIGLRIGIGLYL